jgi:hypothetical protein
MADAMAKPLAGRYGPDTIRKYERAAAERFKEAEWLASAGYNLAALYFYGYTVEMLIKAAYFRLLRYGVTVEIDRDARNRVMLRARQSGLMNYEPHDLVGWAKLLISDKETLLPPPYHTKFAEQIQVRSFSGYEQWRPEMRYRVTNVPAAEIKRVHSDAKWFLENYGRM